MIALLDYCEEDDMKAWLTMGWIAALVMIANPAQAAGNAAAGAEKAKGCAGCHGMDGKGRIPLAGRKAGYLTEQLQAFKSGERQNEMMNMVAKGLSDEDIADLAAYFSSR
jgi:cytochrome c553